MLDLKLIIISNENVQTDLLLLSAGSPPILRVNDHLLMNCNVAFLSNLHRMLSCMMCLIFISPPPLLPIIRAFTFLSDSALSFYLPFIHHQLSAGNLFTCQCPILNYGTSLRQHLG